MWPVSPVGDESRTMMLWVLYTDGGGSGESVAIDYGDSTQYTGFSLKRADNGGNDNFKFSLAAASAVYNEVLTSGQWHHLAFVHTEGSRDEDNSPVRKR